MSALRVGAPQFSFGAPSEPTDPPPDIGAEARRLRALGLPIVLLITHSYGGGTERHIQDICAYFRGRALFLVVRTTSDRRPLLTWPGPRETLAVAFPREGATPRLLAALRPFGVAFAHVHQLFSLPLDAAALIRALAVPFAFTVHDYHTICPRVHLKTREDRYCGEPDEAGCRACLRDHPLPEERDIVAYRARYAWLYRHAAHVICPSRDVADRLARYHPGARFLVVPHESLRPVPYAPIRPRSLSVDEPLRVAILGAVSRYKGAETVLAAARLAVATRAPIRFSIIGTIEAGAALPPGLAVSGAYDAAALPGLLAARAPHLAWFPVLVPETYSYTLSEAFAAGLPVVVPNLGAPATRVAGRPWSWIVPWDATPAAHLERLLAIREMFLTGARPAAGVRAGEPEVSDFYERSYLARATVTVEG